MNFKGVSFLKFNKIALIGAAIILVFSILFFVPGVVFASNSNGDDINIYLGEEQLEFDKDPVIEEGRTLVPFRKLAESIGVDVTWMGEKEQIIAKSSRVDYVMTVGEKTAYLDGQKIQMDVSPRIFAGRTFIPLRYFSETFDVRVDYENGEVYMKPLKDITLADRTLSGFYALGYEGRSSWEELFGAPYPAVGENVRTGLYDEIHLGWYEISADGELISSGQEYGFRKPAGYENVIEELEKRKTGRNMTIFARSEYGGDLSGILEILDSEDKRENLIHEIVEELETDGYSGVNLDFEEFGRVGEKEEHIKRIRKNYVKFVEELASDMKEEHKIIITVHPPNSAYKGYDYEKLKHTVDKFVVMSYDYHDRNNPSPTAPIDKVEEGIVSLKEKVSKDQIVLGIRSPAVKYEKLETELKKDKEISDQKNDQKSLDNDYQDIGEENREANSEMQLDEDPLQKEKVSEEWVISHPYLDSVYELIENEGLEKKWDSTAAVNYIEFEDGYGNKNYIYLESERSLFYKWDIVDEYDLRGISFWRLGAVPDFVYENLR